MRPGKNAVDKAHEKAILEEIWPPNATKNISENKE